MSRLKALCLRIKDGAERLLFGLTRAELRNAKDKLEEGRERRHARMEQQIKKRPGNIKKRTGEV